MRTLYDLLDALPDDDADNLRAAFRNAVKANHPDNNPGDPDAPRRFRRIVRANAILSDERQRATYDRLLADALRQRRLKLGIAAAAFSVAVVAGCLLFGYVSKISLIEAQTTEVSARETARQAAVISRPPSDAMARVDPGDGPDDIGATKTPANPEAVKEATADDVPAANTDGAPATANMPAARDVGMKDAKHYRERGISAYRAGDLSLALIDFDLAIDLDPHFADAYIDRAVVFYRMGVFNRAFDDIARAKHIDDLNRNRTPLPEPQQTAPRLSKN
jgi:curved DNA-binding protein CbpA